MNATVIIGDQKFDLPVIKGKHGHVSIDIRQLVGSGISVFDPGASNVSMCKSMITFVDGENGLLQYRGHDAHNLVQDYTYKDVAYLLIFGELSDEKQNQKWSDCLNRHSLVPVGIKDQIHDMASRGHPMGICSSAINNLKVYYPRSDEEAEDFMEIAARLISKIRSIAAFSYRAYLDQDFVEPDPELSFCENFLRMMFHSSVSRYDLDPNVVNALQRFLILHADHEQNLSTSVVRAVSSGGSNIYACIAAGINALWGPLHGGANERVIQMLTQMENQGIKPEEIVEAVKSKKTAAQIFGDGDSKNPYKLFGFGHKVYKTFDPRAAILKEDCHKLLKDEQQGLFQLAMELEDLALGDDYFREKNLYPNVDFYSGLILKSIGIPENMFTVMFAIGRTAGWVAHFKEQTEDNEQGIFRPNQVYLGD